MFHLIQALKSFHKNVHKTFMLLPAVWNFFLINKKIINSDWWTHKHHVCMMFGLSRLNYQSSVHSRISKFIVVHLTHKTRKKKRICMNFSLNMKLLYGQVQVGVVANILKQKIQHYCMYFNSPLRKIMSTNPLSAGFLICFWQEALSLLLASLWFSNKQF